MVAALFLLQALSPADIDRTVSEGIRRGVFPGAVVVVGTRDSILFARAYGYLTWTAAGGSADPAATLYDLASLSKVVATTPAIMVLVDRGKVDLDQRVAAYLPDFQGAGKDVVTVRNLLAHNSGLRAYIRLDTLARDAAGARRVLMDEALRWKPGTHVEYSDLNAILLGWIVERVSGTTLDSFVTREVFAPLGMTEARYRPAKSVWPRVPPTGLWRGTPIKGEVNDQNAVRLGGVSGHAGVFAPGLEVARYAQFWLGNGVTPAGKRLVRPETVSLFRTRQNRTRALGWEMRDSTTTDNWGRRMGPRTFGHTGFTGTSVWIDPDRDVFAVVLTNRVYAPRNNRSITRLKEIRGQVADAAVAIREESK